MVSGSFRGLQIRVDGDIAVILRFRDDRLALWFWESRKVANRFADLNEDEAGVHDGAVAEGVVINPVADGARTRGNPPAYDLRP